MHATLQQRIELIAGHLSIVSFSISSSALYHASNHASLGRILSGLLSNGTTEAVPKLPNAARGRTTEFTRRYGRE
jgi:hypothetical protein